MVCQNGRGYVRRWAFSLAFACFSGGFHRHFLHDCRFDGRNFSHAVQFVVGVAASRRSATRAIHGTLWYGVFADEHRVADAWYANYRRVRLLGVVVDTWCFERGSGRRLLGFGKTDGQCSTVNAKLDPSVFFDKFAQFPITN